MESLVILQEHVLPNTTSDYAHILFWTAGHLLIIVISLFFQFNLINFQNICKKTNLTIKSLIKRMFTWKVLRPNWTETLWNVLKTSSSLQLSLASNRLPKFVHNIYKKYWR